MNEGRPWGRSKAIVVPNDLSIGDLLKQIEEEGVRRTCHRHRMTVSAVSKETFSERYVCQRFCPDSKGELIALAHKMLLLEERAILEAGVAIPLSCAAGGR
jgi:hypothetical protein